VAVDARMKAEYATRMMHVAAQLAAVAPSDRQARILARYVLVHADSAQRWVGAWHKQLKGGGETASIARKANTPLRRFRRTFAEQKAVRDKIAAKRQAVNEGRAADLQATVAMWQSLTSSGIQHLCDCARAVCDALGTVDDLARPLEGTLIERTRSALQGVSLDSALVYTDVTSYAAGEPNLVSVTVSGALGRRVMQINDIHDQLDILNALNDLASRTDDLGLLLRAALILEVCNLVEQVLGPPGRAPGSRDGAPLRAVVSAERGEEGCGVLEEYERRGVPEETRVNLHAMRNQVAAHLDVQLSLAEIKETLVTVDVDDLLGCADVTLDWLDAAARSHVDLGLLVIGHRHMASVQPAKGPTVPAAFQPDGTRALLDRPYVAMVVGGFGAPMSAAIAGVIAGRGRMPRQRWADVAPASA
jgi:hypothetical protein